MCEIEVHTSEDNKNQNNRIEFNIFDANSIEDKLTIVAFSI